MRQDFRLKLDLSKIYEDARKNSWIFVDSAKILFVNQLVEHVQKLFDIRQPFHCLSRYEDRLYFLPFEEDVRVLENNDTVIIIPGASLAGNSGLKNNDETAINVQQNGFVPPLIYKKNLSSINSEKFTTNSDKSCTQIVNDSMSDTLSLNGTLYQTAFHDTCLEESKDSQIREDNFTEENSVADENLFPIKRKRVRKRKQKKSIEDGVSLSDTSDKKPKIIDSMLIPPVKHIRFKGLESEETTSDNNVTNENNFEQVLNKVNAMNKHFINKDLSTLLSLRQSSTPITFSHKRLKKDYIPEIVNEKERNSDISEILDKSNINLTINKSLMESEKSKENSYLNRNTLENDTISFKVFRLGENYTPQISNVIIAKILAYNTEGSQYTLKILHGKEQLETPEGKFSLPNDDENASNLADDIITLEKSKLLDLTHVKSMGASS